MMQKQQVDKGVTCPICSRCFSNTRLVAYWNHCRSHAVDNDSEPESPQVEQGLADTDTTTAEDPSMESCTEVLECHLCGQWFFSKADRTNHFEGHKIKKRHECRTCGKTFEESGSLFVHRKLHTIKKHKCEKCGKAFRQSRELSVHMRVHSGEKPFQCSECPMRFTQSGSLIAHRRLHTGEKPSQCFRCGQRFSHSGDLTRHLKSHQGIRSFKCPHCKQCFTRRSTLVIHLRSHTSEKPLE